VSESALPTKITELRALLKAQFPEAHASGPVRSDAAAQQMGTARFGIPALDTQGLPTNGGVVEVISPSLSRGGGLLLSGLLESVLGRGGYVALIDGQDSFDPASLPEPLLKRMLWVRCKRTDQVPRCADLLLRDGNLPIVIADLQFNAVKELQRIPDSTWFRLRAQAESSGVLFFAFTPCKTIAGARLRLQVNQSYTLDALDTPRAELLAGLSITTLLQRHHSPGIEIPALARAG